MSEHDSSPEVLAAIEREKRLWKLEQNDEAAVGKLEQILTEVTALKEQVAIQNGRVSKNEQSLREVRQHINDREELVEGPRWGRFESVAAQVAKLWEERAMLDGAADGRSAVLRFQWRVVETAGRIVGSSVVIGGVIALLKLMGVLE